MAAKDISLGIAILVFLSSVASARPTFAQGASASFEAIDEYISTKMKKLGIPGAIRYSQKMKT
jgi:hypothetical protein